MYPHLAQYLEKTQLNRFEQHLLGNPAAGPAYRSLRSSAPSAGGVMHPGKLFQNFNDGQTGLQVRQLGQRLPKVNQLQPGDDLFAQPGRFLAQQNRRRGLPAGIQQVRHTDGGLAARAGALELDPTAQLHLANYLNV